MLRFARSDGADCEIAHPGADRLRAGDDRRLDAVSIIDAARGADAVEARQDGRAVADHRRDHRADPSRRSSERKSRRIQSSHDGVILSDQASRAARDLNRRYHLPQRILQKHDMRRFLGDLGTMHHGDPDIGMTEGAESH